jgi:hypothetical protein
MQEGTVIAGDFVIGRPLGRGGMGTVYAVHQLSTGRAWAMKLLHSELARDEATRQRFLAEARVPARVGSAHLCDVIAAGIDASAGTPYLVMELLEGETLGARLKRGPLAPDEARRWLAQIAAGLGAAHRAHLVHRDLKPENVFIARRDGTESIKILDFGIAKVLRPDGSASTTMSVGSPAWMAPEQAQGGRIGPWTDVWAFGLVAFEALAGVTYWLSPRSSSGTVTSLLLEILAREVIPASARSPRPLPAGFDAWFARALSRDEAARFPDLDAAWRELAPVLDRVKVTVPSAQLAGSLPASSSLYYGTTLHKPVVVAAPAAKGGTHAGLVVAVVAALLGLVALAGVAVAFGLGVWDSPRGRAPRDHESSESEEETRAEDPRPQRTEPGKAPKKPASGCKETDEFDADCVCTGSCNRSCASGLCRERVLERAELSLACKGGSCDVTCEAGSACRVACPGGSCVLRCAAGADCSLDCTGGFCKTACDAKAKCLVACEGGFCEKAGSGAR